MAVQYTPTPLDLLRLLGCTERKGEPYLKELESTHNIKLPPLLFDFFSAAWNHPLFRASDVWPTC
ncbi:MAG: hypothetical protein HFF69_08270 [Oscillospiraceae bacterium]|jgi:hypothetical protein|nr:hypothetical protein [Oscillospiraceae bacterium]